MILKRLPSFICKPGSPKDEIGRGRNIPVCSAPEGHLSTRGVGPRALE